MPAHEDYRVIYPEDLLDDPANAAVEQGYVGDHSPRGRLRVGAWRWDLVQKYREPILKALAAGDSIDFGGGAGPIGYGAEVVDRMTRNKAIYDVRSGKQLIFCSHTFEHIVDITCACYCFAAKLDPGGLLVIHVPSWRHTKLNAGNWPFHEWTFTLAADKADAPDDAAVLDSGVAEFGFEIEAAEDDRNNIIVLARKK